MASDTKKFLVRFIEEARKHITQISSGLLSLETQPDDKELINTIFRCVHTIKGSSNMMNLQTISNFTHEVENNLSAIRDGSIVIDTEQINLLLKATDQLSNMIDMAENQQEPAPPDKALLEQIKNKRKSDDQSAAELQVMKQSLETETVIPEQRKRERISHEAFLIRTEKLDDLIKLVSEISLWNQSLAKQLQQIAAAIRISEQLYEADRDSAYDRIHDLLSQLKSSTDSLSTFLFHDAPTIDHLNIELRDALFNLRLVPINMIFEKFPRIVRELAAKFGKEVDFSITGENTELDKKIVEMIDESLIQIIRNAIDHGIESIDVRKKRGKPANGHIHLKASYEHGMCQITIADDGAGIQTAKLLDKAVQKNLITEADAERIKRNPTPDAIADLVFTPGLSASDIITDLSGRGVGMDIVRENIIHKLNGSLQIETHKDRGTTFTIILPINTAILDATRLRIGSTEIAIPTHTLNEIVRLDAAELIEVVGRPAIRLREQIIPVVRLEKILQQNKETRYTAFPFFLIIKTATGLAAIIADDIIAQGSFMIHSLPQHIQQTPWVSGCIITGTNSIINLLNTRQLMEYSQHSHQNIAHTSNTEEQSIPTILVVDDSISTRDIEKSILESHGYQVEIASDGEEAFGMVQDYQYDLIITDIEMPHLNGITLVKMLRKNKSYRHTPIIIVSSRESEEDKIRGVQAGADAYIVKSSFDQDNLIETIKTLIG